MSDTARQNIQNRNFAVRKENQQLFKNVKWHKKNISLFISAYKSFLYQQCLIQCLCVFQLCQKRLGYTAFTQLGNGCMWWIEEYFWKFEIENKSKYKFCLEPLGPSGKITFTNR